MPAHLIHKGPDMNTEHKMDEDAGPIEDIFFDIHNRMRKEEAETSAADQVVETEFITTTMCGEEVIIGAAKVRDGRLLCGRMMLKKPGRGAKKLYERAFMGKLLDVLRGDGSLRR